MKKPISVLSASCILFANEKEQNTVVEERRFIRAIEIALFLNIYIVLGTKADLKECLLLYEVLLYNETCQSERFYSLDSNES